jgi:5'(3')-deoxyribonucleotidase
MKNIISEAHRMRVLAGLINESEDTKSQIQVWFDLDGVLADMEGALQENEELTKLKANLDAIVKSKFPEWANLSNDELKVVFNKGLEQNPNNSELKELKKAYKEYNNYVFKIAGGNNFYADLKKMPGAVELVQNANKIIKKKSHILTAGLTNDGGKSEKEKRKWVEKHFGDLVDRVEVTTDKGRVAKSKYDVLIDDRTKYVDKFTSAGGTAILFKNPEQAISELEDICKKYNEKN